MASGPGPGPSWADLGYRICAVYEDGRRTKRWCIRFDGGLIRELGEFDERRQGNRIIERHYRQHRCKHWHVGTIKGGDGSTWCADCRKRMD